MQRVLVSRPKGPSSSDPDVALQDLEAESLWADRRSEMVLLIQGDTPRLQLTAIRRNNLACALFLSHSEGPPGWITSGGTVSDHDFSVESQDVVVHYPSSAFLAIREIREVIKSFVHDGSRSDAVEWVRLSWSDLRFEELWDSST